MRLFSGTIQTIKSDFFAAHAIRFVMAAAIGAREATALLESQNTVDVYDFGVTREGSFYYAMELLNGIEMAMGEGRVDGRADLYSLGCVAYWLLTGTRVFEADNAVAMVLHHVKTEPPPLSDRTELEVPDELEELVRSCLAKDPETRPKSAAALADRLSAVPLRRPWSRERAEGWWNLHLPARMVTTKVPPGVAREATDRKSLVRRRPV